MKRQTLLLKMLGTVKMSKFASKSAGKTLFNVNFVFSSAFWGKFLPSHWFQRILNQFFSNFPNFCQISLQATLGKPKFTSNNTLKTWKLKILVLRMSQQRELHGLLWVRGAETGAGHGQQGQRQVRGDLLSSRLHRQRTNVSWKFAFGPKNWNFVIFLQMQQ